jgi:hypothetical protein
MSSGAGAIGGADRAGMARGRGATRGCTAWGWGEVGIARMVIPRGRPGWAGAAGAAGRREARRARMRSLRSGMPG